MDAASIEFLLNEERFPGNLSAFADLRASINNDDVIPVIGAGASVPIMPTWSGLLHELIMDAFSTGRMSEPEKNHYLKQRDHDPLQVADDLEELYGRLQFRSKIANLFRTEEGVTTECHDAIILLGFNKMITLNYDDCLETSYARSAS